MNSGLIESLKRMDYLLTTKFPLDSYIHSSQYYNRLPNVSRIRSLMCEQSVNNVLYGLGFRQSSLPIRSTFNWFINDYNNVEVRKYGEDKIFTEIDSLVRNDDILATVEVKAGRVGDYSPAKVSNELESIQEAYNEKPLQLLFLPYNRQRLEDFKKIEHLEDEFGVVSIDTSWTVTFLDKITNDFLEFQGMLCDND